MSPADPYPCPNCGSPLFPGSVGCARCGISLVGPQAQELAQVDQQLMELAARRRRLIYELSELRPPVVTPAGFAGPEVPPPAGRGGMAGQQILLALGALLVLGAALVFLAVNWELLGPIGQLGVALTAAALSAALARWAVGRGLTSSAEAFGALSLLLVAATCVGAQLLELFPGFDTALYVALSAALCSALAGAAATIMPVRAYRFGALVAFQLVLPAVAIAPDWSLPLFLGSVSVTGFLTLAASRLEWLDAAGPPPHDRGPLRTVAWLLALLSWAVAVVGGYIGIWAAGPWSCAAVVIGSCAGALAVPRHPARVVAPVAASSAAVAVCYDALGPYAGLAVAAALTVGALADVRLRFVQLQLAALAALAGAVVAALSTNEPRTLSIAALLLWFVALRHIRVGALAVGPATVLAVGSICADAGASLPLSMALIALVLAAVGVAALEADACVPAVVRPQLLVSELVCFGGLWLVGVESVGASSTGEDSEPMRLALSISFAAAALVAAWVVWRMRLGWVALPAAGSMSLSWWFALSVFDVALLEIYTFPAALVFAAAGWTSLRKTTSVVTYAPAAAIALFPTATRAIFGSELARLVIGLALAGAIAVAAVRFKKIGPLTVAAVTVVFLVIGQLNEWSTYVPRWALLAAVGVTLLFAGVTFEQSRRLARTLFDRLRSFR